MIFDKIFGQEKLTGRLLALIEGGRADGSYLLTGAKGIGKWAYAFWFAAAYCCQSDNEKPCGKCKSCKAIANFHHPDIQFLFPFPNLDSSKKQVTVFQFSDPNSGTKFSNATADEVNRFLEEKKEDPYRIVNFEAKSNIPAEVVRDLRKFMSLRPMWGGHKAVVISDIERMAPRCADLLLKTIEEPPKNTVIILTSMIPEKLPATIISRCKVFTLNAFDDPLLKKYLASLKTQTKYNIHFLSRASGYSPGMARSIIAENVAENRDMALGVIKSVTGDGRMFSKILNEYDQELVVSNSNVDMITLFQWILRDLAVLKNGGQVDDIINCDRAEILSNTASRISKENIYRLIEDLNDIRTAVGLSNVMPSTAVRHLLSKLKEGFSAKATA